MNNYVYSVHVYLYKVTPPLLPCRDVLQSTVRALYGAVVNSLELSSLVHSVLGDPPLVPATPSTQDDHTHPVDRGEDSHTTLEESVSGLSERLLTQQGERCIL